MIATPTATETTALLLSRADTTVHGHDAVAWEVAPTPSAGFIPEGSLVYEYIITLDGGARLVAATDNILQPDVACEEARPSSTG